MGYGYPMDEHSITIIRTDSSHNRTRDGDYIYYKADIQLNSFRLSETQAKNMEKDICEKIQNEARIISVCQKLALMVAEEFFSFTKYLPDIDNGTYINDVVILYQKPYYESYELYINIHNPNDKIVLHTDYTAKMKDPTCMIAEPYMCIIRSVFRGFRDGG